MKINILGQQWQLIERNERKDPKLKDNDGYCDSSTRTCVVDDFKELAKDPLSKQDLEAYKRQVKRHELIHAFFSEAGLEVCSWAHNEELVDFLAIQFPKIAQIFKAANIEN